uniref:Uncharacterized protein n=1 Tax=Anguilla anguilla TaxID=7936 RepID=A0A0E9RU01_ANGAN
MDQTWGTDHMREDQTSDCSVTGFGNDQTIKRPTVPVLRKHKGHPRSVLT